MIAIENEGAWFKEAQSLHIHVSCQWTQIGRSLQFNPRKGRSMQNPPNRVEIAYITSLHLRPRATSCLKQLEQPLSQLHCHRRSPVTASVQDIKPGTSFPVAHWQRMGCCGGTVDQLSQSYRSSQRQLLWSMTSVDSTSLSDTTML